MDVAQILPKRMAIMQWLWHEDPPRRGSGQAISSVFIRPNINASNANRPRIAIIVLECFFGSTVDGANIKTFKAALHVQRFECAGAATKIDFFGSDRKCPRWELNSFLLPERPKIGRLRSDLLLKLYQLRMLLLWCSARALKTLDMESSL